jgi:hypothetical protein
MENPFENFLISAVAVDNEPFYRSLTATLMGEYFVRNNIPYNPADDSTGVPSPQTYGENQYSLLTGSSADLITWFYPKNAFALNIFGNFIPSGSALPVSACNTLIFYYSADPYNFLTENYSLSYLEISASSSSFSTTYSQVYDSFPDIDLTFYLNYEKSNGPEILTEQISSVTLISDLTSDFIENLFTRSLTPEDYILTTINETSSLITYQQFIGLRQTQIPYFYRLTNSSPFTTKIKITSDNYSFLTTGYNAFYNIGGSTGSLLTNIIQPSSEIFISRTTPINVLGTITLSANTPPNSRYPWFSSHRIERQLEARFVDNFITVNDIQGWKKYNIINSYTPVQKLDENNTVAFLGLNFIGEGHTETIFLSTNTTIPGATSWKWVFNEDDILSLPLTSTLSPFVTTVTVTSEIDFYPTIPITLRASNSAFSYDDPIYWYDDNTGVEYIYPYVKTTVNSQGEELISNNNLFQSIRVLPYNTPPSYFDPGIEDTIYLPANGSIQAYKASFDVSLSAGLSAVDECYDKFGYLWAWTHLLSADGLSANQAKTWVDLQSAISAGTGGFIPLQDNTTALIYPKRWQNEGNQDAYEFNFIPLWCVGGPVNWSLSSINWNLPKIDTSVSHISSEDILFLSGDNFDQQRTSYFDYNLRLLDYGQQLQTVSTYETEILKLQATRTLSSCIIGIEPYDWKLKETELEREHFITSISPPIGRLYTPNYYVLTGTPIKFENVTTRLNLISALEIKFDPDASLSAITLYPETFNNDLYITYTVTGFKNVQIKAYLNYDAPPLTFNIPNILRVVENYDIVNPKIYRSPDTPLIIPHTSKPQISPNETVLAEVYNTNINKIYENLEYLENRGSGYLNTFSHYHGWLGAPFPFFQRSPIQATTQTIYTWEQVDCNVSNQYVTWFDAATSVSFIGNFVSKGTWAQQSVELPFIEPSCYGRYQQEWRWKSRTVERSLIPITWAQTKSDGRYPKRWYYESADGEKNNVLACDEGFWNLSVPGLNLFYDPIPECEFTPSCAYTSVASKNNILLLTNKTAFRVLSSNYTAMPLEIQRTYDGVTAYTDVKSICIDSENKIFTLDKTQARISVFKTDSNLRYPSLFNSWGGFGSSISRNRFNEPNDIHVDQHDNVWVADTGNGCIKLYSNTGAWIRTIKNDNLSQNAPLSICIDSQNNLHVLTSKDVQVYSYNGNFLSNYEYISLTNEVGVKINTSHNREIIYLCTKRKVVKFFRTGSFAGTIIQEQSCVNNITDIYHDEYRNLLVAADNRVLKFVDTMLLYAQKGTLPPYYWKLEDLYIHPEEYVQNWVYNKSLQRLWDNIEYFRSTVFFTDNEGLCKQYQPPKYKKEDIIIHQNEIVTSAVLNRVFNYLWENFITLIDYFDPSCKERLGRINI